MERVDIFIDGSNFYHGLRNYIGRTDVNFYEFAKLLCGPIGSLSERIITMRRTKKRWLTKRNTNRNKIFFSGLYDTPYLEVRLGRLEPRGNTFIEKGVDIFLAVDMLKYAYDDMYDTAILVSGDGDFAEAMEAVKDQGKHIEHAYFKGAPTVALKKACDKYIPLDEVYLRLCFICN